MMKCLLSLVFIIVMFGCSMLQLLIEIFEMVQGIMVVDVVEGDKVLEESLGLVDILCSCIDLFVGDFVWVFIYLKQKFEYYVVEMGLLFNFQYINSLYDDFKLCGIGDIIIVNFDESIKVVKSVDVDLLKFNDFFMDLLVVGGKDFIIGDYNFFYVLKNDNNFNGSVEVN